MNGRAGMYCITKEFHFCAGHRLHHLPSSHKCASLHGHNYVVELVISSGVLDDRYFVEDYGDLDDVKRWIDEQLDHAVIVDRTDVRLADFCSKEGGKWYMLDGPSTAENLARHIFKLFRVAHPRLTAVRVSETPKTWAEYRG